MTEAEFLRWAGRFTEPLLMVSAGDGRILACNTSARELLGDIPAGIAGKTIQDVSTSDTQKIRQSIQLWARSGQMTYGYARVKTANGDSCRCEGALLIPQNGCEAAIVVVRLKPADTTVAKFLTLNERIDELGRQVQARLRAESLLREERANLERHVAERTAELRELVSQLEAFSYSISHDMRGPLRAINSFAQLLSADFGDKLDSDGKDYLRRITVASERLDRLILDVLQYSRLSREELPLTRVNIENLLRDIVEQYPDFTQHAGEIRFSKQCENTDVLANGAALTQVISNLLGNAIKFVPPGEKPNVQITCEERGDRIKLSVRDSGIGIAPQHVDRIFNVFEKLNKDYSGTGIGLAIVKRAVVRMGGTISVHSEPGRGSVFSVELPAFRASPAVKPNKQQAALNTPPEKHHAA